MSAVEALARCIAARLGLPFEDCGAAESVFFGWMPDAPVKAVCVTASGLRPAGGGEGSRVQVLIRSDLDAAWAIRRGEEITALLDEARDLMPASDGPVLHRVAMERGFGFTGLEGNHTQFYAAEFTAYVCQ